jgi:hypothetical protein
MSCKHLTQLTQCVNSNTHPPLFAPSALRLNPDATHIWSYLRIAFTVMDRFDLVQKSEDRNIDVFGVDGAPF